MSDPESIDLSGLVPLESFTLAILDPRTKKPTGWKISLAGPQHDHAIGVASEVSRDALAEERAVKLARATGQDPALAEDTVEARRRRNIGRVCRRIIGWSPDPIFRNVQATPIAFSVAAATDLFLRPDMAGFFVQITSYLNSEQAFIPPSEPL